MIALVWRNQTLSQRTSDVYIRPFIYMMNCKRHSKFFYWEFFKIIFNSIILQVARNLSQRIPWFGPLVQKCWNGSKIQHLPHYNLQCVRSSDSENSTQKIKVSWLNPIPIPSYSLKSRAWSSTSFLASKFCKPWSCHGEHIQGSKCEIHPRLCWSYLYAETIFTWKSKNKKCKSTWTSCHWPELSFRSRRSSSNGQGKGYY